MGMNEIKRGLGSVWLLLSDEIGIKQGCWGLVCHVVCLITATPTETKSKENYNRMDFLMLIGKIKLGKEKRLEEFLFNVEKENMEGNTIYLC